MSKGARNVTHPREKSTQLDVYLFKWDYEIARYATLRFDICLYEIDTRRERANEWIYGVSKWRSEQERRKKIANCKKKSQLTAQKCRMVVRRHSWRREKDYENRIKGNNSSSSSIVKWMSIFPVAALRNELDERSVGVELHFFHAFEPPVSSLNNGFQHSNQSVMI